jgi:ABC-type transport system involved in multi-copper enzyme maturation permease subunit
LTVQEGWFVGATLAPWAGGAYYAYSRSWIEFGTAVGWWARIAGSMVACLLLLGVAVRAAGSISGERDRQTFDSLLTSPLDSTSILFAKWLGSILSVRWGWLWLGSIYLLGVATTGINLLAVPLLLGAWFIYAGFLAIVGLWFSAVSRTTLRATLWTLLTVTGVGQGHLIITICCGSLLAIVTSGRWFDDFAEHLAFFQLFGLTPAATLGVVAFDARWFDNVRMHRPENPFFFLLWAVIGLGLYAMATALIWSVTSVRFRQLTGRLPLLRPAYLETPRPSLDRRDAGPVRRKRRPAEDDGEFVQPLDELRPRGAILIEEEWQGEEIREDLPKRQKTEGKDPEQRPE